MPDPAMPRLQLRRLFFSVLLVVCSTPCARALLNLEGSRNQVFVFGSVSFAYSSNIFYEASGRGDTSVDGEIGIDVKRRAGLIAVSSTAKLDYQRFIKYTGESAFNPYFSIEFTKITGRLTGSLSVKAYRESRSDSAVNLRTNSWNIPISLSLKYPLNDKFYVSSQTGYLRRNYAGGDAALTNYVDYSEALDAFYIYSSKLDLVAGYRLRLSKTTIGTNTYDHWFNVGATGALFAKINGELRVGYQIREIDQGDHFNHVNALAGLNWTVTRKFSLSSQISRDFNTIATGFSVDATSVGLRATYLLNRKTDLEAGVGYGRNSFLGNAQGDRRDEFYSWDLAAHYRLSEHWRLGATYGYLHNTSNVTFANFNRQGLSFDVSARY